MIQKKLFVKNMIKQAFCGTKDRIITQFCEIGIFKEKSDKFIDLYFKEVYHPMIDNYLKKDIEFNRISAITEKEMKDRRIFEHKKYMDDVRHRRKMVQDEKDNKIREEIKKERIKQEETKQRREWKRIERIKSILNFNIRGNQSKYFK